MTDAIGDPARLERRLARERAARREAETIAEAALTTQYEAIVDLTASQAVLDETPDFVAITDAWGMATYVNRALRELLGLDAQDGRPVSLQSVLTEHSFERLVEEGLPAVAAKGVWRGELAVVRADGGTMPVSQVLIGHRNSAGVLHRLSFIARDMTEQQDHADLLAYRSLHDALTGLPNRRLFFDRLDMALARTARTAYPLAVLFIDLDGFKAINDTHGHEAGDRVLIAVAERLSACMRSTDTLARLGGDEFVVLCEVVGDAAFTEEIAHRLIAAAADPITLPAAVVQVGMSIGIALTSGSGPSADDLVHAADRAMYDAKTAGKGTCRLVSLAGAQRAAAGSPTSDTVSGGE